MFPVACIQSINALIIQSVFSIITSLDYYHCRRFPINTQLLLTLLTTVSGLRDTNLIHFVLAGYNNISWHLQWHPLKVDPSTTTFYLLVLFGDTVCFISYLFIYLFSLSLPHTGFYVELLSYQVVHVVHYMWPYYSSYTSYIQPSMHFYLFSCVGTITLIFFVFYFVSGRCLNFILYAAFILLITLFLAYLAYL